jgi:glucose/arabinose dehydrogenase
VFSPTPPVTLPTQATASEGSAAAVASPSAVPTLPPTQLPPPQGFPEPSAFIWRGVAEGLESPVDLQNAGDARLFIVEQRGMVRIFDDSGLRDEPFLDIRDRVNDTGNEQGLLGLAFSPSYASDGAFFVNYTMGTGDTIISRFRVSDDPNRADPDSEQVLLKIDQPYANHNGGRLAFGLDGDLYIGTGDGGSQGDPQGRAQNLSSLLGKILRLDVRGGGAYAIPPDNPFSQGGGRPEIWAYGLRNPWRFAFDSATGDLFIGDVGQDTWEEIDVVSASAPAGAAPRPSNQIPAEGRGANFGWNLREGLAGYNGDASPAFTDPVAVYSHAVGGCSVTGGEIVRDPALPEWQGVYLYGDFCTGLIWGLFRDAEGNWQNQQLYDTAFQITSFGTGSDGRVYVLDRAGGVYRLHRAG